MNSGISVTKERKGLPMDNLKVQFIFKGFSQDMGSRVFEFDGIASDRTRTPFTVRTDLALTRRYGIRLQELPLLCRAVLELRHDGEDTHEFAYTEADMNLHREGAAARLEAAKQRKPPRRPATDQVGAAWRLQPR